MQHPWGKAGSSWQAGQSSTEILVGEMVSKGVETIQPLSEHKPILSPRGIPCCASAPGLLPSSLLTMEWLSVYEAFACLKGELLF